MTALLALGFLLTNRSMRAREALVASLGILTVLAQPRATPAADFHGRVVDGVSGEPLQGAVVVVITNRHVNFMEGNTTFVAAVETSTDAEGRFTIDTSPGTMLTGEREEHVAVFKPGYHPYVNDKASFSRSASLFTDATVRLGKITDPKEMAVPFTASDLGIWIRNESTDGYYAVPPHSIPKMRRLLYLQRKLMESINPGLPTDAQSLVAIGANVNAVDQRGLSALMHESQQGRVDAVQTLLSEGANVHQVDANGWSALTYAAYFGHVDLVRMLLSEGADPNAQIKEGTLLLLATRHMVVALIGLGGGPTAIIPAIPITAGQSSAQATGPGIMVMGAGPPPSQASMNAAVEDATQKARAADVAVIEVLLQHRADPNRGDEDGLTPLMYAAARGRSDLVNVLIRHGARVDAASPDGITPWQVAAGDEVIGRLDQARKRR